MTDKPELLDVLDNLGHPTGQAVDKAELHQQGLLHQMVHLWVYNSRAKILLQMRAPHKEARPGTWDISAGGHVDAGETPEAAIMREANEELGLEFTVDELEFIGVISSDDAIRDYRHRTRGWTYLLKRDVSADSLRFRDGEVTQVQWTLATTLAQEVADDHLRTSKYSGRDRYIYDMAVTEILRRTQHG